MLVRKLTASLLSFCLAASMCPAVAFASQLEAGSIVDDKKPVVVSTQSAKAKKQYVISSIGTNLNDKHQRNDYTYYKNGLLKSETTYPALYTNDGVKWAKSVKTYKYNKKGLLTKITVKTSAIKGYEPKSTATYVYKYDSNGKAKSCAFKQNKNRWTANYSYDSNGVLSLVDKVDGLYIVGGKKASNLAYTTYNSKGQLVKEKQVYALKKNGKWEEQSDPDITTWKYDSKGYVKQSKSTGNTVKYKNIYKKGRLVKVKGSTNGSKFSFGVNYKKVTVSSKFSKIVKQQQLDLINPTEYYI